MDREHSSLAGDWLLIVFPRRRIAVRYLHHASLLLLVAGVVLTVAGVALSLPPLWTLIGLMLAIAGGVKVLVVYLWRHVLRIDDPV